MRFNASKLPRAMALWAGLVALNALPSFIIAMHVEFGPHVPMILAGVMTLWVIYVLAVCIDGVMVDGGVGARAMRLAVKIRTGIALVSLLFVASEDVIFISPDFYSGFAAGWILILFDNVAKTNLINLDGGFSPHTAYLLTVTEGLLVSFLMLMLAFFILLILQRREARKQLAWPPEGPPDDSSNNAPPAP